MILSISYSTLTFVMKLATAFACMGLGLILDAYGFNAEAVTETAVNGIRLWYGLIPVILGIIVLRKKIILSKHDPPAPMYRGITNQK